MCTNCATKGSVCAEPQREEVRPSLNEAGEELVRALESALIEQALSRAKTREDDLERRIAALEEKLQWSVNTFLDNYFRKRSAIGCASFTFYH